MLGGVVSSCVRAGMIFSISGPSRKANQKPGLSGTHTVSWQIPAVLDSKFRGVAGMSHYPPPLKERVASLFPPPVAVVFGVFCREEKDLRLGGLSLECLPRMDRATWGCSSYTHTNRATLCH